MQKKKARKHTSLRVSWDEEQVSQQIHHQTFPSNMDHRVHPEASLQPFRDQAAFAGHFRLNYSFRSFSTSFFPVSSLPADFGDKWRDNSSFLRASCILLSGSV